MHTQVRHALTDREADPDLGDHELPRRRGHDTAELINRTAPPIQLRRHRQLPLLMRRLRPPTSGHQHHQLRGATRTRRRKTTTRQ